MVIAGIDYSMSSPSICVGQLPFDFSKCTFHYLTDTKKYNVKVGPLNGSLFPLYNPLITKVDQQERFHDIGKWALNIICSYTGYVEHVYLEDYSFGSKGRVFHIAENTGLLKFMLWTHDVPYTVVSPTAIKKFATGKGNSNKEAMEVAFIKETNYNIKSMLGMTEKNWSPSSDIIDSYYICKYGSARHDASQRKCSSEDVF